MNADPDGYTEAPEDVREDMHRTLRLKLTSARAIWDTLHQIDTFLGHDASPTVRAELRAFCTTHGYNSEALLDGLGLQALVLRWAIDAATNHTQNTDHTAGAAGGEYDKESM